MQERARLVSLFLWTTIALALIVAGTTIESTVLNLSDSLGKSHSFWPIALFFSSVNLNVLLLFVLVFLTFRNGVKLVVDRRKGVLGSSLRTKLVTSFLFFSLLPTVILLYISTKFVNANFEKWLPQELVQTTKASLQSELAYRDQIVKMLGALPTGEASKKVLDFAYSPVKKSFLFTSEEATRIGEKIAETVTGDASLLTATPRWIALEADTFMAVKKDSDGTIVGIMAPPSIHPKWQLLSAEFSQLGPGIGIIRISYYVMLGVLTLLIVFSATWLGFTIAREFTIPIQILAAATESVAQGNYLVKIDDIVTDDELGRLALSFRSMVTDLRSAKEEADRAALEIRLKAAELSEKSEYNAVLLRDINAAVVSLNEEGLVESWNQQAEFLFGVPEEAALRQPLDDLIEDAALASTIKKTLAQLYDSDHRRLTAEYFGRVGAHDHQLHISVSEIVSPQGCAGTVVFINDLTELARAQRLAAWRDVARSIAHEIKNPLTPIKLGTQRLQKRFQNRFEGSDLAMFDETVNVILHSTQSIKGLVDEFIKFARMPQPIFREGNLREAIQMAVAGFADNSEHVGVQFEAIETVDGSEVRIATDSLNAAFWPARFDPDQIVRLFVNLISNAIAASAAKGTQVIVQAEPLPAFRMVRVKVMDFGIGIPDEVKAKIFEPYFSTKRTGTGLGLVIVQQIVRDHNARLTLEDNLPVGSVFCVEMPLS